MDARKQSGVFCEMCPPYPACIALIISGRMQVVEMVKSRLSQEDAQQTGWLLDGYPRSADQAEAIEEAGIRPDVFILIDVSTDPTSQSEPMQAGSRTRPCRHRAAEPHEYYACILCNGRATSPGHI